MNKSSKIYVAGHRGLVGSAILRTLKGKDYLNFTLKTSKELDLRRQADTETYFEKERPEYVFLAAARVGGILANDTYKAEFIYDNVMIAANTVNSAWKYGVKKILNLGSSCIYPRSAPQPMKEEYLLTGTLEPTNEPYAIAKIAAIKLCKYYNEQYGTNFISVMPANLYGLGDNFNLEISHLVPALLRKFHLAKLLSCGDFEAIEGDIKKYKLGFGLDGKIDVTDRASTTQALKQLGITENSVVLWGSGGVFRELLHVDDLADACVLLMENCSCKDIGEFVNIGTGEDIKVRDLAGLIKDVVGFDGDIQYDISKPDGTPRKLLDVSVVKNLGWRPRISLKDGVRATYEWYCS